MASPKSNKPVAQFRARGVSASVFVNSNEEKKEWYSITLSRVYNAGTDKKPDLQNTNSFNENDLPLIEVVSRKAFDYCLTNKLNKEE